MYETCRMIPNQERKNFILTSVDIFGDMYQLKALINMNPNQEGNEAIFFLV